MTLHLLRLGVDLRALHRFAVARRLDDDDAGYALHAALAARFGDAAPRPFRFFAEACVPHLLGYASDAAAAEEASALPVIDALVGDVFPAAPQLQPMPATWRAGGRYAFELRVRPVVRFGARVRALRAEREGAWQRGAGEVDAYVAACERAVLAGDGTAGVAREPVYVDWLTQRLGEAATLETAGLRAFRRSRSRRSTHAASGARTRAVEGPDAVIAGTLAVGDPAAFAQLLAQGVGRHAAFGYGMLLLSPAGRAG